MPRILFPSVIVFILNIPFLFINHKVRVDVKSYLPALKKGEGCLVDVSINFKYVQGLKDLFSTL